MSCEDPQHRSMRKGRCSSCNRCVYCLPGPGCKISHKRKSTGRPSTNLVQVQVSPLAEISPTADIGAHIRSVVDGEEKLDGIHGKRAVKIVAEVLGVDLQVSTWTGSSTSASNTACNDISKLTGSIVAAMCPKGIPNPSVNLSRLSKKISKRLITLKCLMRDVSDAGAHAGEDDSDGESDNEDIGVTEDEESGCGAGAALPHRLVNKLLQVASRGSATTKRYALSFLCAGLSRQELNSLCERYSIPKVGVQFFSSRRSDFNVMAAGRDLHTRRHTTIISVEAVLAALDALHSMCKLSWRNGVLRTITVGKNRFQVPLLQRQVSLTRLIEYYKETYDAASQETPALDTKPKRMGMNLFRRLANMLTVPARSKSCVSYYYTDGVVETFPYMRKMLARLHEINRTVGGNSERSISALKNSIDFVEDFVKYELESHFDESQEGCAEGMHCCRFALGANCMHEHVYDCSRCATTDMLADELGRIVDEMVPRCSPGVAAEMITMKAASNRIQNLIFKFVRHLARGKWQDARLRELMHSIWEEHSAGNRTRLIVELDHKRKVLPMQYRKSQRAGYAEAGMVLLGSMVMVPVTEGNRPKFRLSFIDVIQLGGDQDNVTTITNLEAIVHEVKRDNPYATELVLVSDNATTFAASNTVPFIVRLNDQLVFSGSGIRIAQYHFNEAQRGRGILDTHFSYVQRRIRAYVDAENDVRSHADLFEALQFEGGVAASTTMLHRMPSEWSKKVESFSTKITTGSRRIHNLIFLSEEQSTRRLIAERAQNGKRVESADAPACLVQTNTGLMNPCILNGSRATRIDAATGAEIVRRRKIVDFFEKSPKLAYIAVQPNPEHRAFGGEVVRRFKSIEQSRHNLQTTLDNLEPRDEVANDEDAAASAASAMGEGSDSAAEEDPIKSRTLIHQCDKCKRIFHRIDAHNRHVRGCNGLKTADDMIADGVRQWLDSIRPVEVDSPTADLRITMWIAQNWSQEALLRNYVNWAAKPGTESALQLPEHIRKALMAVKERDKAAGVTTPVVRVMDELGTFMAQSWDTRYITTNERVTNFFTSINQKQRAARVSKKRREDQQ